MIGLIQRGSGTVSLQTVLFDFDGTIADTLPVSFEAFRYVFNKYDQRSLTNEEIIQLFGPIEDVIIRNHLRNKEKVEHAIEDFYDLYEKEHNREFEYLTEIQEMLDVLKDMDINLGIVTGKSRRSLTLSLELLNLYDYFDVTISGDEVKTPKPDPEGIQKSLFLLHNDPSEAIVVGDSQVDIAAGASAHVTTIAAQWFSTVQTSLYGTKPTHICKTLPDFIKLIKKYKHEISIKIHKK